MERASFFSKIRSKIDEYQKRQYEKDLERQERRRIKEVENLVRYPEFNHLANCPKQSGIKTYVLAFGDGGFGAAFCSVRGTCRDCEADQSLD